jgi:hypothetical protein
MRVVGGCGRRQWIRLDRSDLRLHLRDVAHLHIDDPIRREIRSGDGNG